jgi:membrane protease YdiL (CAAX protease family)
MDLYLLYVAEWIGAVAVGMIAGLSPKFTRVKLVFKYPRREGVVALGVAAFTLFIALAVRSIASLSVFGLSADMSQRVLVAAAGLVPVIVALWRRKQPVRSAGWSREKLNAALQLGLALVFLSIFLRGKFSAVVTGLNSQTLSLLGFSLLMALMEETAFRGFIQPRLASWWGEIAGWLAAAGLFVICQLPRLLAAPEQLVFNLVVLAGQTLVAGYVMRRSGHALAPSLYRAVSSWLIFFS